MIMALPKSVLIALNLRKASKLSEKTNSSTPTSVNLNELLLVFQYLFNATATSSASKPAQGTKSTLLGNKSHKVYQLCSKDRTITPQSTFLRVLYLGLIYLTSSPIPKATMQMICETMKQQVPIMKEGMSLDMRSTSPTRLKQRPALIICTTEWCLWLFLRSAYTIISIIGRGFRIWRGQIRSHYPTGSTTERIMIAKLISGSGLRALFQSLASIFFYAIILIIKIRISLACGGCPAGFLPPSRGR